MKAYKGFDKDLKCRDFQYEIGKEYEEKGAKLCKKGFHACEYPLDCFCYYPPNESKYCEVRIEDTGERKSIDTKVCGEKIKIGAEIGIKGLIKAALEYTKERCINSEMGADSNEDYNGFIFNILAKEFYRKFPISKDSKGEKPYDEKYIVSNTERKEEVGECKNTK